MQNAWNLPSQGSRAFQLQQKLKNVRKELYTWNINVFGKVDKEIRDKQRTLQEVQGSIRNVADIRVEKKLREDIENLMEKEEIMWAQKARSTWIIQGSFKL